MLWAQSTTYGYISTNWAGLALGLSFTAPYNRIFINKIKLKLKKKKRKKKRGGGGGEGGGITYIKKEKKKKVKNNPEKQPHSSYSVD